MIPPFMRPKDMTLACGNSTDRVLYMFRGTVYGIAVLALVVNALTPRAIVSDSWLSTKNSPTITANSHARSRVNSRVNCPQPWHELRENARAFSCPPLPSDIDVQYIQPDVSTLEEDFPSASRDFVYDGAWRDSTDILFNHRRLNI